MAFMAKVYIDVPTVAYETWLISSYVMDCGKLKEVDEDDLLKNIESKCPYRLENKHA